MESVLIVSSGNKSAEFISGLLHAFINSKASVANTCGQARRMIAEKDYDLVIINAPLADETGESLSREIALKNTSQVILLVKSEFFNEMAVVCEPSGILLVTKPLKSAMFNQAVSFAKSAFAGIKRIQQENRKLKQKMDEMKLVSRAKLVLVTYLNMGEQDAHRYIEKQAMDARISRREVAEGIIKTYES